jgi:hypothetical protein
MVFSSPLTDLFMALQLTDIGYRKSMPSSLARERVLKDGLPLTAEVKNLRIQLKCCPEYSNRFRWATWEKWDFRREKDTKCLEEHPSTISSHPRYDACLRHDQSPHCLIHFPIHSTVISVSSDAADYSEEAPSPYTLISHLKALPSDSTHA